MLHWFRVLPILFLLSCGNCAVFSPPPAAAVDAGAKDAGPGKNAAAPPKPRPPLVCPPGRYCVLQFDFQGDVDEEDVTIARDFLADAAGLKPSYVVLRIDTRGGNIDEGFKLAHALEEAPYPVVCVVDDVAYSMGFFILQSCDTRLMTPRAKLLAHEARYEKLENMTAEELVKKISELRVSDNQLVEQACRRLHMSHDEYKDLVHGKEWYMTPADALKVGAVDQIWHHDTKTLVRRLAEFGTY